MTVDKSGITSAGILLFRRVPLLTGDGKGATGAGRNLEVLLAHPGGPYWVAKDLGHWTIPKGEVELGEDVLDVARREFEEETGHRPPDGPLLTLGDIRQKSGKLVVAWAVEGDLDPSLARSNTFEMEWPPHSGLRASFPEIDRVEWFGPQEARRRLKAAQVPFLERLEEALMSALAPEPGETGTDAPT